jgi:hypothetical protein
MNDDDQLRPLERRVRHLMADGVPEADIAQRFRRSPDFIRQVVALSELPNRTAPMPRRGLRPIERRILRWREQGAEREDIAARFQRRPDSVARIEELARYKLAR